MVWAMVLAAGGGAFVEEDDGVAEQDGDGDGEQQRQEPVARGGGAIAGKGLADGMLWR